MRRERAPLRAGYMGHLTEIANSLQAVAARRPAVARTLCSNAAWTDFAFGPLAERNQVLPLPLQLPSSYTSPLYVHVHLIASQIAKYRYSATAALRPAQGSLILPAGIPYQNVQGSS